MLYPVSFFRAVFGHSLGCNKCNLTVGMVKKETREISTSYRDVISLLLRKNTCNKYSMINVGYEVIKKTTKQVWALNPERKVTKFTEAFSQLNFAPRSNFAPELNRSLFVINLTRKHSN